MSAFVCGLLRVPAEWAEAAEEAARQRQEEADWQRGQEETWREAQRESRRRWPQYIYDSRFERERSRRNILCDDCGEWKKGDAVGTFAALLHRPFPAAYRREAWERGEWSIA